MRMHAHLLSTQSVLDTFDTGFRSTRNRIEVKILVSSQPYCSVSVLVLISQLLLVVQEGRDRYYQ